MAGTKVATIMVSKLQTTGQYCSHFVVEIYSDVALTNLVGRSTSTAEKVSGVWHQKTLIQFKGLTYGNVYYLRAGVVAPQSSLTTWSATWDETAGNASIPACGYATFVARQTGSGTSYTVTPSVVPADIDHFEAWWSFDGSAPVTTSKPMMTARLFNSTQFLFFVGYHQTETPTVYLRAVSTSHLYEAWQALGAIESTLLVPTGYVAPVCIQNGNFLASLTIQPPPGWTTGNPTDVPYFSIVNAHSGGGSPGNKAFQIVEDPSAVSVTTLAKFHVTAGEDYKVQGNVYLMLNGIGGHNDARIGLQFFDATGIGTGSIEAIQTLGVGWQFIFAQGAVPAGSAYCIGYMALMANSINNNGAQWTNIAAFRVTSLNEVSKGSVADGSTIDCGSY
jgi:hypothetical protein